MVCKMVEIPKYNYNFQVSFGVIVDRLLLQPEAGGPLRNNNCGAMQLPCCRGNKAHDSCTTIDSMEEIREELLEIAEQIM